MIVCDLDLHSSLVRPPKAHAPLVVDMDAVLPYPVTVQGLEPVGRRHSQVGQGCCRNHSLQPHSSSSLNVRRNATGALSVEEPLSVTVLEPVHLPSWYRMALIVIKAVHDAALLSPCRVRSLPGTIRPCSHRPGQNRLAVFGTIAARPRRQAAGANDFPVDMHTVAQQQIGRLP